MQDLFAGGLRLAGLSMRMILALFMAKYLSFHDIGIFSLLVAVTGLLPGAAGLGLSYFVNRDLIGMPASAAIPRARDRLIVTALCSLVCSAALAAAATIGTVDLPVRAWVCAAIILLEMVGFDLHLILIARGRATVANLLLFVRSALWIPVFMAIAFVAPTARTIDALTEIWLGGLMFYGIVTAIVFRHVIAGATFWTSRFDLKSLVPDKYRLAMIWISDFSLAFSQNIDRFIVSSLVGLSAAGVYYFYFSIANAAFLAVQSATTQPYMPRLRELYRSAMPDDFVQSARAYLGKVLKLSVVIFTAAQGGTLILVHLLDRPELDAYQAIMPIILLGMVGKAANDYLGILDYIMERDRRFVMLNVLAFLVVLAAVGVMTWALQLYGTAAGMAATMILFAGARWWFWLRDARRQLATASVGAAPCGS